MSHDKALERLKQVMDEEGVKASISMVKVDSQEEADKHRFIGSPTILVNGEDIQPPDPATPYVLTCRAYFWEDGRVSPLPSHQTIRTALLKHRKNKLD